MESLEMGGRRMWQEEMIIVRILSARITGRLIGTGCSFMDRGKELI